MVGLEQGAVGTVGYVCPPGLGIIRSLFRGDVYGLVIITSSQDLLTSTGDEEGAQAVGHI